MDVNSMTTEAVPTNPTQTTAHPSSKTNSAFEPAAKTETAKYSLHRFSFDSANWKKDMREFVELPYKLYRYHPLWTPKLKMEYLGNRLLGQVGMLEPRFPFHQRSKSQFFMVRNERGWVGRIVAFTHRDYDERHGTNMGFFGFYESINDPEVARLLIENARQWCEQQGCTDFMGPFNFTVNHTCGFLLDAYEKAPFIDMPYNPAYYHSLMESQGLTKAQGSGFSGIQLQSHETNR